jgi:hypothetical protein
VADRVTARIDAHNGVLYARHADTRTATFHFALKAGASLDSCPARVNAFQAAYCCGVVSLHFQCDFVQRITMFAID